MNKNRRSSEDLELQEIGGSKAQRSQDQSAPLIQPKPHEPHRHPHISGIYAIFRRYLYGRNLVLYICLGILLICMLILLLYFLLASSDSGLYYKVINTYVAPNQNLYSSALKWQGSAKEQESLSLTRKAVLNLNMSIQCYSANHLHLTIGDTEKVRWRIPETGPYPHVANPVACNYNTTDIDFSVQEDPFSLKVWRKSTKEVLIDMSDLAFVFSQNYIEFNTRLPSFNFYGLGERLYKFEMGAGTYTIFPTDRAGDIETGQPGHSLYGQQPMYLLRENSGNYHIVLLRNSNAMEIQIGQDQTMKFQVVGGILDFHLFLGSKDPESLVETYHDYLGNWLIPPFWSMGYQQSKWGYANVSEFTSVLQGYRDNNIPLDVIWSDIDYMLNYIAFTIDTANYPMAELQATLTEYDKKWVPIIDVGIGNQVIPENIGYARGLEKDVFLKDKLGNVLVGRVWAGDSVFPDFFHPNASSFWTEMLEAVYIQSPFDGIWLDMNEISNFCNGSCVNKTASIYDDLPFFPGNTSLDYKTLSLDAIHYGGTQEFDAHSVFSILQQEVTYNYLKTKNPMPFILSRANIFGSGKFSSHWFGDQKSDWISMRYTVASMFNYNLFGIPHNGADICGFIYATTPELCTRWTQLGAFYPFARNHHEKFSERQEPFLFQDPYKSSMITAIKFRYSILKQFYTLFLSKGGRGTIIKPLFFEFPNDTTLFGNGGQNEFVEQQFMVGKSVMVAPVLYEKATQVQVYFPAGSWYSLITYQQVKDLDKSRNQTIDAPLESMIPTYIRGGWICMVQDVSTVMSTRDLTNEFSMIVALDGDLKTGQTSVSLKAIGEILDVPGYTEDVVSTQCIGKDCVLLLNVELVWNSKTSKVTINLKADRRRVSNPPEVNGGNVVVKEIRVLGSVVKRIDADEIGEVSLVDSNDAEGTSRTVEVSEDGESLLISVEGGIVLGNGSRYIIAN